MRAAAALALGACAPAPRDTDTAPRAIVAAPAGRAVLYPPLAEDHPASSWFDHEKGRSPDGTMLPYTGIREPGRSRHVAYDWVAPRGTPVYAAADGAVLIAGDTGPACGAPRAVRVEVHHEAEGLLTQYLHLDEALVVAGAAVGAGEQIGTVGSTGCASGAHLHFEVRDVAAGVALDPYGWEGEGPDPWAVPNTNLWAIEPRIYGNP